MPLDISNHCTSTMFILKLMKSRKFAGSTPTSDILVLIVLITPIPVHFGTQPAQFDVSEIYWREQGIKLEFIRHYGSATSTKRPAMLELPIP